MKPLPALLALLVIAAVAIAVLTATPWLLVGALLLACAVLTVLLLASQAEVRRLRRSGPSSQESRRELPGEPSATRLPDLSTTQEKVPVARGARAKPTPVRSDPSASPEPLSSRAGEIIARHAGRLPEAVLQRTHTILKRLEEVDTLIRLGRVEHENAHLARRIALEFLPESLEGYLLLPPSQAMTLHLVPGKTGYDLLMEELSALGRASKDLLNQTALSEGQALLVNHEFIREKFRSARREFDV
ncbi:hypothetical protein [Deinococcus peraridilitoris]|uniref:Uncharacterized protein n=1 Tax=Deinococcus peraridilitoris (strain DSM 19664 / LMG 22246 / CIP 109416 / KR-200) TaxID=937777 RepID=L0A0N4_DEIPD|nr:hypothetical protein [Deinococcus peraridilitoris]AFZ67453.1 hypothetical protein Deipe_1950 [Deinococcus peraridilitoris DSM 19664]